MGNFSKLPATVLKANLAKGYAGIHVEQGVPVLDRDLNLLNDLVSATVQRGLALHVGDGLPVGSTAFQIVALSQPSFADFRVVGSGVCLVGGMHVVQTSDTTYLTQALPPGAAPLPAVIVVGPSDPDPRLDVVYLDVWMIEVDSQADPDSETDLKNTSDVQLQTSVRLKPVWVVRIAQGVPLPAAPDGHAFCPLAVLARPRTPADAPLLAAMITDKRNTKVTAADIERRTSSLEQVSRPVGLMRDALNALLRGELAGSEEAKISPAPGNDFMSYAFIFDHSAGVDAFWYSNRLGPGADQIFTARFDSANPSAGFVAPLQPQISSNVRHALPHAASLPTGDVLVTYNSLGAPNAEDVVYKRAAKVDALAAAAEQTVTATANVAERHPFVIVVPSPGGGGLVLFFWRTNAQWLFRRRRYTPTWAEAEASWADTAGVAVPGAGLNNAMAADARDFHAALAPDGSVWLAYKSAAAPSSIQITRVQPSDGTASAVAEVAPAGSSINGAPFLLISPLGLVWFFLESDLGIFAYQIDRATNLPIQHSRLFADAPASNPSAVFDRSGGIWLFVSQGSPEQIWAVRWSPTFGWTLPRVASGSAMRDFFPFATTAPDGMVWLFWRREDTSGTGDLFYRQILTEV